MRVRTVRMAAAALLMAAAGGCGGDGEGADDAGGEAMNAAVAENVDLFASEQNQTTAPEAQARACPDEPGVACSGPLLVRTENLALSGEPGNLVARGTLVVENRTEQPVRFTLLREPVTLNLDNGAQLAVIFGRSGSVGGLTVCRSSGERCLQEAPETFQTLEPGESPARLNLTFEGRVDGSLVPTLPSVETGTATMQLYVVEAAGGGRRLQIALPNTAIRNQLAE